MRWSSTFVIAFPCRFGGHLVRGLFCLCAAARATAKGICLNRDDASPAVIFAAHKKATAYVAFIMGETRVACAAFRSLLEIPYS
jgi:hypothetical protein